MGQAKKRGTLEDRKNQVAAKIARMKPNKIICNECQGEITDIQIFDSHHMRGIDAAFAGQCSCGCTTWAISGTQEAIATFAFAIEHEFGKLPIIGSIPIPTEPK